MKYVVAVIVLLLCAGGIFMWQYQKDTPNATVVPEGFHLMDDGTLMQNTNTMDQEVKAGQTNTTTAENKQNILLDPNATVVEIKAINYQFDVEEIKVKKGETVTIQFESTDGFHDWVVDEFDARTEKVSPGKKTSVTFVANQAGTFEYYCSIGSHRSHGMVGKLIVEG